jgi:hypothetical protein
MTMGWDELKRFLAQANIWTGQQTFSGPVGIGTTSPPFQLTQQSIAANESATLSAELLTANGWTSDGWTGDFATGWIHTTGNTTALTNTLAATVGYKYQITYTVTGRTAGSFTIAFGGQSIAGIIATGAFGPTALTTATLSITPTTDFDGKIVISIKRITGVSTPTYAILDNTGTSNIEIRSSLNTLNNTFLGKGSGAYNTTGNQNSAIGMRALYSNTTGYSNSAVGMQALYSNTTGYSNSATGMQAGRYISGGGTNQTSNNSVYLGYDTRALADGDTNEIVIGASAIGIGSNTVVLGNDSIVTTALKGKVGIGLTNPSTLLELLGADNTTVQTIKINADQAGITAADTFIDFRSTTGSEGSIAGTATAGVIAYNTFTGSHYTQVIDKDRSELKPGMLLEIIEGDLVFPEQKRMEEETYEEEEYDLDANDEKIMLESIDGDLTYKTKSITRTRLVEKTYQAAPKEQLFATCICKNKGSKAAVGVYGGTDKEGRDLVLSLGTGIIWVSNKGLNLEIGDFLISSDVAGCAEKQADDVYRNSTVAKTTEKVVWLGNEQKRQIKCIYTGG